MIWFIIVNGQQCDQQTLLAQAFFFSPIFFHTSNLSTCLE